MKIFGAVFVIVAFAAIFYFIRLKRLSKLSDSDLIESIYTYNLINKPESRMTHVESMVYKIRSFDNEMGSGENYIQWFKWTDPDSIGKMPDLLTKINCPELSKNCQTAISYAFPNGIPDKYNIEDHIDRIEFHDDVAREKLELYAKDYLESSEPIDSRLAEWVRSQ